MSPPEPTGTSAVFRSHTDIETAHVSRGVTADAQRCANSPRLRNEDSLNGELRVVGRRRDPVRPAVVDAHLSDLHDGALAVRDGAGHDRVRGGADRARGAL